MLKRDWKAIIETQIKPMLAEPGITRHIIAERLDVSYSTARHQLSRYNIEVPRTKFNRNRKSIGYFPNPMETVLSEPDCIRMRRFLSCLTTYADMYPGQKVDVAVFMKGYSDSRAWDKEV